MSGRLPPASCATAQRRLPDQVVFPRRNAVRVAPGNGDAQFGRWTRNGNQDRCPAPIPGRRILAPDWRWMRVLVDQAPSSNRRSLPARLVDRCDDLQRAIAVFAGREGLAAGCGWRRRNPGTGVQMARAKWPSDPKSPRLHRGRSAPASPESSSTSQVVSLSPGQDRRARVCRGFRPAPYIPARTPWRPESRRSARRCVAQQRADHVFRLDVMQSGELPVAEHLRDRAQQPQQYVHLMNGLIDRGAAAFGGPTPLDGRE